MVVQPRKRNMTRLDYTTRLDYNFCLFYLLHITVGQVVHLKPLSPSISQKYLDNMQNRQVVKQEGELRRLPKKRNTSVMEALTLATGSCLE